MQQNRVFVLGHDGQPLDLCHPARARQLLRRGRAAVFRHHPFTIILKDRTSENSVTHPHRLTIDPGAKTTGIALVRETDARVVWAAEIHHRGDTIRRALATTQERVEGGKSVVSAGPWRVRFLEKGDEAPDGIVWRLLKGPDGQSAGVQFICPWCGERGIIPFRGRGAAFSPFPVLEWDWNGSLDTPTLSQSILVAGDGCNMHVWVRDGWIVDAGTPPHGRSAAAHEA